MFTKDRKETDKGEQQFERVWFWTKRKIGELILVSIANWLKEFVRVEEVNVLN